MKDGGGTLTHQGCYGSGYRKCNEAAEKNQWKACRVSIISHLEVSPPVHISADRTPLMDGGGAQSSQPTNVV